MAIERGRRFNAIDWENLVLQASTEQGSVRFVGVLQQRLSGYFRKKLPTDPELARDLAQDAIISTVRGIGRFTAPKDFNQRFNNWVGKIAYTTWVRELRRKYRAIEVATVRDLPSESREEPEPEQPNLNGLFKKRIEGVLTSGQYRIVELALEGKSSEEIATILGLSITTVRSVTSVSRRKIEKAILTPVGLKRAASYGGDTSSRASDGSLRSIRLLGVIYTNDEWVNKYDSRRQVGDEVLEIQGYLLLSEVVSATEYARFMSYPYKNNLVKKGNRLYVHPDVLSAFRESKVSTVRFHEPNYNLTRVGSAAKSPAEQKRLNKAIKKGELKAEKIDGWWYAADEEINKVLSS